MSAGGEVIPGATVLEQGTTNGTGTDADGRFSLTVKPGATLVVSAIGFKSQVITVGGRTNFDVRLEMSTTDLGEVIGGGLARPAPHRRGAPLAG